jgi:HD-GYP domain-containing protein (c-di-GMP phosphodiesterase class II)
MRDQLAAAERAGDSVRVIELADEALPVAAVAKLAPAVPLSRTLVRPPIYAWPMVIATRTSRRRSPPTVALSAPALTLSRRRESRCSSSRFVHREHVDRMARVDSFLGARLGLDPERVHLLQLAAPMHDVGKIATPSEILRKPGPLTPEEREEMKRHTTVGHEILANSESELLHLAAIIALTHHEHYDGSEYPQGVAERRSPSRKGSPRLPASSMRCSATVTIGQRSLWRRPSR